MKDGHNRRLHLRECREGLGALEYEPLFIGYSIGFRMIQNNRFTIKGPDLGWKRVMYFQYDMDAGARDYLHRWNKNYG
jgi:hypothetical protein